MVAARVRDPSKWWRPDGTRPQVNESTDGLIAHDPKYQHDDNGELIAVRAFCAAMEAGDFSNLDALAAAAEKAERDQERKAAQKAERDEARRRKGEAQLVAINELIEREGMSADEAESLVVGEPVETIRKRNYLSQRPGWDGTITGFDKAVKDDFYDEVDRQYWRAEQDLRGGSMVKRKYEGRIDPMRIWLTDSDATAREYASEDLQAWFDQNPGSRPTLQEFRDRALGLSRYSRRDDYNQ